MPKFYDMIKDTPAINTSALVEADSVFALVDSLARNPEHPIWDRFCIEEMLMAENDIYS